MKKSLKWLLPTFTLRGVFLWELKISLIALGFIILFVASVWLGFFGPLYSKGELASFSTQNASLVYSKEGTLIGKFFSTNRTNITKDSYPNYINHALVAAEDERFYQHNGVDVIGLLRVFFKTILLGDASAGGGSTISQQLAKNMVGRENHSYFGMPIFKIKEIIHALRLEEVYEKDEILLLYLNTVPFGENVYGLEAAALRFFGKPAKTLNTQEGALLVGMLKANTAYNPRLNPKASLQRRNLVLSRMLKSGYLTINQFDSLERSPLSLDYTNLNLNGKADYFLHQIRQEADKIILAYNTKNQSDFVLEKDGLIITTTLDISIQNAALKSMEVHLRDKQMALEKEYSSGFMFKKLEKLIPASVKNDPNYRVKSNREVFYWEGTSVKSMNKKDSVLYNLTRLHSGFIGMNPHTGAVVSYVGGINHRYFPYDQIMAKRQLASSFKPILYLAALQNGFEPCDYLSNDSVSFPEYDNWSPENYDKTFGGKYAMWAALSRSLNIPTVNLFQKVGYEALFKTWRKLGFTSPLPQSPSVALGTVSASLWELAKAYACFANGGFEVEPYFIEKITTSDGLVIYQKEVSSKAKRIFDPHSIALLNEMLQQTIISGTAVALRNTYGISIPIAGKTGTSQNYSDAWFGAYNPGFLMVTRVGASYPSVHFSSGANGSGSALALPMVGKVLQQLKMEKYLSKMSQPFPYKSDDYAFLMDCPAYKEETMNWEDVFSFIKGKPFMRKVKEKNSTKPAVRSTLSNKKPKPFKRKKRHFKKR